MGVAGQCTNWRRQYAPLSSPNETDGLEERAIDPREFGLERGRGGERGEDRWDPLDIYLDFVLRQRTAPRRANGRIAGQTAVAEEAGAK